jgi:hypothetical protein
MFSIRWMWNVLRRHPNRSLDMKSQYLLLCITLAVPLPAMAIDETTCAALVNEIDMNLKAAALAEALSATSRDPATAASNTQTAASTLQSVDRKLQMLEQNECPPYPRPPDTAGYHNDALLCAYDILKQRTGTPPCDQSTWTLKGRSETWHSLRGETSLPARN